MEGNTRMHDSPPSSKQSLQWPQILLYGLVILGTVLNLLYIIPNGHVTCVDATCGIRIGEWHYHDALWHIAVARNSFTSFPLLFPSASGFELTSYNYLLGFIIFLFEWTKLDPFFVYFKLLPLIGNVLLVYTLFRYFSHTQKTRWQQIWITFFMYFGSSLSYLLIWYRGNLVEFSILKGFPVVATVQPAFVLSNVQFFLTIPIILYIFTDIVTRNRSPHTRLIHASLLALSIGLKIYSGLFVGLILLIGLIDEFISNNNFKSTLISGATYLCVSIVSVLIFYLPFRMSSSAFPFVWAPFAIPHVITESPGLFYHKDFTLGRYFMYGLGTISPRLIFYELLSTMFFILWNLGSRVIVFVIVPLLIFRKAIHREHSILFALGSIGLILPILFIQSGGGWYNTIQFAYVGVYLLGVLAGLCLAVMTQSRFLLMRVFVIFFVIITIPNNLLMFSLLAKEKLLISSEEIHVLTALKQEPRGVVLSFPDDKNSSYVPALSNKIGYMIDYEQARLLGLPVEERIKKVEARDCSVLADVRYVYVNSIKGTEYLECPGFIDVFRLRHTKGEISLYMKIDYL